MRRLYDLLTILKDYKRFYLTSAFLLVLSALIRTLEPRVVQIAIDGVVGRLTKGDPPALADDRIATYLYGLLPAVDTANFGKILIGLGLLYVLIALARSVTMLGSGILNALVSERAIKRLRDRLFLHLQKLPVSYFSGMKTGELIQRCTGDVETIKGFINNQITDFVLLMATFIFAFAMMWSIHWQYALIATSIVPIVLISTVIFFKKEGVIWEKHEAEQDKLTSLTEENLAGVRVVKSFARESYETEKFDRQNRRTLDIGIKHVFLHAYFWTISDFSIFFQFTLVVVVGAYYVITQQITLGELSTFYSYVWMLSMPMRQLGRIIAQLSMTRVALERLSAILEVPTEQYEPENKVDLPQILSGDIEFRNVWFRYQTSDENWVLQNVSFHIKSGQKVAFMGPTGAGKSTTVALLLRFYEPEKGEIYLDGLPINRINKTDLRRRMGVVMQKPFLFSTTIAKNIAYTNTNAPYETVLEAATAASIHEISDIFPLGYETLVGEKGVTLSGGQKQRVALARTLLDAPQILILDDTTSAVDAETEEYIRQSLKKHSAGRTTLIIANRISSVADADQILVLSKGRLVQHGTHQTLWEQEGFYKQVFEVQAAVESEW